MSGDVNKEATRVTREYQGGVNGGRIIVQKSACETPSNRLGWYINRVGHRVIIHRNKAIVRV